MTVVNMTVVNMTSEIRWHLYFMTIAYVIAGKSKDPRTKVGAVIVDSDRRIVSTGYNGFPEGVSDDPELYLNIEYKYSCINHAEQSAVMQCARAGTASKNCTLYCFWLPCVRCATFIIQAGIVSLCYHAQYLGNRDIESALQMHCKGNELILDELDVDEMQAVFRDIVALKNREIYFYEISKNNKWLPEMLLGLDILLQSGVKIIRLKEEILMPELLFQGRGYKCWK